MARIFGLAALAWLLLAATSHSSPPRFDTVVIDAGHGGSDEGAHGSPGRFEKALVLDLAKQLAERLEAMGLKVILTRKEDVFVPLEARMSLANDARADLFVSLHANASEDTRVAGVETFFLSRDASDESSRRVARRENAAFGGGGAPARMASDPLLAVLGDLIATEHLSEASEFAGLVQKELALMGKVTSRGVKQAPFVVLMGVQMPAALVEVGFLTNPEEEKELRRSGRRVATVEAIARAVRGFGRRYDARRGVAPERSLMRGGS